MYATQGWKTRFFRWNGPNGTQIIDRNNKIMGLLANQYGTRKEFFEGVRFLSPIDGIVMVFQADKGEDLPSPQAAGQIWEKEQNLIARTNPIPKQTEMKTQAALPKIRLRRIIGVAYSYSRNSWAGRSSLGGSYYPRVGLEFRSGLVSPYATIDWDGSYSVEGNQLCLYIKKLEVPARSALEEFYLDFGVGYGIELENAVFDDYTVSKVLILFRTFLGDTPPKDIKKCYGIRLINQVSEVDYKIGGEWEGEYIEKTSQYEKQRIPFVARIVQAGDRFEGSAIDSSGAPSSGKKPSKARCKIEGWVVDGKITFTKKYENSLHGVSYVASCSGGSTELSGTWFSGLKQGGWYMKRKGNFEGSPDDILSLGVVSSNE